MGPGKRSKHSAGFKIKVIQLAKENGNSAAARIAVGSPSLEESILNVVADRPESSTRAIAHHVSMSHQTICRLLNENRLHLFHFQRVQALNPAGYLLLLPIGGTAM
ncbi:hypothetical protein TNCV_33491 [Trichonephila clavipes]|nr:hypothetical protein TNCV_33491 [Trichonephila clavipes]